jgi:SAM-dependent methyltransferase
LVKSNAAVKAFFDSHSHQNAYHKDPVLFDRIVELIFKSDTHRLTPMVLDLGCGDGSFIDRSISAGVRGTFIGLDVSFGMLSTAQSKSGSDSVHFCLSDAFHLPFPNHIKFDAINMSSVLHHIIGSSRTQSLNFVRMLLKKLINENLKDDGTIIIDEGYYYSYLIPNLSSSLIFYGLKLLNRLHLNIGFILREFQPGLEVNFLTDKEIRRILEALGDVSLERELEIEKIPRLYRVFLVKRMGHLSFFLRKRTNS